MDCYELVWKRSAERELRKLPREVIAALVLLAEGLVCDPYPPGARKLAGARHTWRVRSGDYRLIYTVEDARLVVQAIRVGHRREVYR